MDAAAGYPTCNARLLDGVTPWAWRFVAPTTATNISRSKPFEAPQIGKINSLADGVRTLTVELAIEESLVLTKQDVSILAIYEDMDGNRQVINSYDPNAGALDVSTTTWSIEVGGQVAWYPGPLLMNKRKFSITTPNAIKSGTEVVIFVRFSFSVADITKIVMVDPEIGIV